MQRGESQSKPRFSHHGGDCYKERLCYKERSWSIKLVINCSFQNKLATLDAKPIRSHSWWTVWNAYRSYYYILPIKFVLTWIVRLQSYFINTCREGESRCEVRADVRLADCAFWKFGLKSSGSGSGCTHLTCQKHSSIQTQRACSSDIKDWDRKHLQYDWVSVVRVWWVSGCSAACRWSFL